MKIKNCGKRRAERRPCHRFHPAVEAPRWTAARLSPRPARLRPHPARPALAGGAAVAVQFVINYEEGGENSVLHGDAASEAFLSEIVGAPPWLGAAPHEHGEHLRIRRAAPASGACGACSPTRTCPLTVYGVASALARNPAAVAAMREAGWEIASHGLRWIDYQDFPRATSARRCKRRSACTPR